MKKIAWRNRWTQIVLGVAIVIGLVMVRGALAGDEPVHLVTDWSHAHLIFSAPKNMLQRFQLSRDPRYLQQLVRRSAWELSEAEYRLRRRSPEHLEPLHGDWNVYLGNVGMVGAGQYPAKFSFNSTTANCASATSPDFVVYNTNLAGSGTSIAAFDTGTFLLTATLNSTITIKSGANTLVMTAGTLNANTGTGTGTFNASSSATNSATNFVMAIQIANNGSFVGVTASSVGPIVTITATTAGAAGNSITVTASTTPASNFTVAFANLIDGAGGVPTVVAYDNLYSSCTGTVPSNYWAYNTGGTVQTSVVLSLDGTQVAFVQSVANVANLVILKWAASSGTPNAPVTLTSQTTAAAYRSCTAPCMYKIAFNGGLNDTQSSPFYDYSSDNLYVGDDPKTRGNGGTNAFLHKFSGIFKGDPAEVVTAGAWPATLGVELASSPVFDLANEQVYVADSNTVGTPPSGGFLYKVNSSTGAVVKSGGLSRGAGFTDGPIVDTTNGTIYLYSSDGDYANGCPNATTDNDMFQMSVNFVAGATAVTTAQISPTGTCSATLSTYDGTFDNLYLSGNAGNIYVCGDIGANPTLYQVAISATGALGAVNTGPAVATTATTCSSVVEFYNPGANPPSTANDWIFLSTQATAVTAAPINCPTATGCLMSFNVTSGAAMSASTATTATVAVAGGASGVIVDNSATAVGASQVYFTPLASGNCTTSTGEGVGGCSIQASQAALH